MRPFVSAAAAANNGSLVRSASTRTGDGAAHVRTAAQASTASARQWASFAAATSVEIVGADELALVRLDHDRIRVSKPNTSRPADTISSATTARAWPSKRPPASTTARVWLHSLFR